jgi:dTDP-4-amino-4,6-dideoxygalactose transaminase
MKFGRASGPLRVTEQISERLIRLPLWVGMKEAMVARVVDVMTRALEE